MKELDKNLLEKMEKIAEEIFETKADFEQMPITEEFRDKLSSLSPYWINYRLDENGNPISWAVVVPTDRNLAEKFLNKEINEKELAELSVPRKVYSALYFCSAITIPECRKKGLALELLADTFKKIHLTKDALLFAWPTTEEGFKVLNKLRETLKKEIRTRNKQKPYPKFDV